MMKTGFFEKERFWLVFLLIFSLIFFRYCYFGFQYFPQLDDYIQMHNQSGYYTAKQVILDMGLLSSRPLASVGDYFLWSRFWECMIVLVGLLSAMYAASAMLFRQVWGQYFGTGYLFLTIYALLPLGTEGTYWVSASTRVIPALLLTAMAMWLFQRWCRDGKRHFLALYFVAQLLSYCFYEQGLVLCVTGVLLVGLLEFRAETFHSGKALFIKGFGGKDSVKGNRQGFLSRAGKPLSETSYGVSESATASHTSLESAGGRQRKRSLFALLTFVNVGIYFAFTGYFSTTAGQLGSRLKLTLPWQAGWGEVFKSAVSQTGNAYITGTWKTTVRGFRRGLEVIFSDLNLLWVLVLVALCALLFFAAKKHTGVSTRTPTALVVGFLMALAPVTLFFVLSEPSIGLRNTAFSFCGLALMADALFSLLIRKVPHRGVLTGAVCAVLSLIFCVAAVSELSDYRQTYENDQRAGAAVRAALDEGQDVPVGTQVAVVGLQGNYLTEQNFDYHEHIHGATESSWAFTGLLACESGNWLFPYTTPIPNAEGADLSGYGIVLYYDHATGVATIKE